MDRLPALGESDVSRRLACYSVAQSGDQTKPRSSTKKRWVLTGLWTFNWG